MNASHQNGTSGLRASRPHSAREHARTLLDLRGMVLHPLAAWLVTLALLGGFTWFLRLLDLLTHAQRPYTIFYMIPVAAAAALLGLRGGLTATVLSLLLAWAFLFPDTGRPFSQERLSDGIELVALATGSTAIAFLTGWMRATPRPTARYERQPNGK